MTLLDRLGFGDRGSSRSRRPGLRLEGRTPDEPRRVFSQRDVGVRLGMLAVLTALALVAFPNVSVYDGSALPGEVWHSEDVVAPFDFSIRLSDESVAARRDSVRRVEPPIVAERPEALTQSLARLDTLRVRLDSTFAAYAGWQRARADASRLGTTTAEGVGAQAAASRDSVRFRLAAARLAPAFTERAVAQLAASSWATATRRAPAPALHERVLAEADRVARESIVRGVADVPRDSLQAPLVRVRNLDPSVRSENELPAVDVLTRTEASRAAQEALAAAFPDEPEAAGLALRVFESVLEPSLLYQAEATARARDARADQMLITRGRVRQGMTLIRRGDVVTPERHRQLVSLDLAQRERSGVSWVRTVFGRFVLVLAALSLLFLYLYLLRPAIFDDDRQLLLVVLLLGLVLTGFLIAGMLPGPSPYGVPVALVTILLTIVFDSRVGSFAAMTLALIGGMVFGFDFSFAFATMVVGVLAVFSVRDVKNRSQLLVTAGLVFAAYAVLLTGYALLRADPFTSRYVAELVAAGVSAILVLLAAPILWGIERTFRVTTDMTLLELSDTNRPLLKELSLRAPGTFNHVLQVANLAEAAADAVGANALRARVGALYHDIGKMLKPEYFIENQQPGNNPHERLKPSMSALVIAAHVKDGVELGREHALPQVVLSFIASHHGTSLIEFFYRKALEAAAEGERVDEAEFRYPGPRPETTEEAIVMLADSVEAASRSLDKPTPRRLQSLLDAIFDNRQADGQLDRSPLTFADLTRIKETFHGLLCGIYHFRVRYPDQPDDDAPAGDGAATVAATDASVAEEAPSEGRPTLEERSTLG